MSAAPDGTAPALFRPGPTPSGLGTIRAADKGRLEQKGVMHKLVDLSFKTKSDVGATPDGKIRVHTRSVKILGFLPVKPIMKLFSIEMDLELIDLDADDPFNFSVDHWNDMLIGGFSKNMPNQGLKTYMPDYDDLEAGKRTAHSR